MYKNRLDLSWRILKIRIIWKNYLVLSEVDLIFMFNKV